MEQMKSKSLIDSISDIFTNDIHFAAPISSLRTSELDLVRGVLQMLQGFSGALFSWDCSGKKFHAKSGIYVSHLSRSSLLAILNQFMYAATCLQLTQLVLQEVNTTAKSAPPTLRAFVTSVSAWLKRLRDVALKEEIKLNDADSGTTPTLMGLAGSLSSLCSGAEYLLQIVHVAIPKVFFESSAAITTADLAVHVLDNLYKKLDEVCLIQNGQEETYQMLLHIFVGSLLPYIEELDSWVFEGILDDPFEELFFYANEAVSVGEHDFWEKSYSLRSLRLDGELYLSIKKETIERESISSSHLLKGKDQYAGGSIACPLFIKGIAKSIVAAGKSLQLIRHVCETLTPASEKHNGEEFNSSADFGGSLARLSLSELFCVSLAALIGDGDHISRYFWKHDQYKLETDSSFKSRVNGFEVENGIDESTCRRKHWYSLLADALALKGSVSLKSGHKDVNNLVGEGAKNMSFDKKNCLCSLESFYPENPVMTVCTTILKDNINVWKRLNLSRCYNLPPLNDEGLLKAIFGDEDAPISEAKGTDFTLGFQFDKYEYVHSQNEAKLIETLFPFPTLLPAFQDDLHVSDLLPFQKNSTLPSRVLSWMQNVVPRTMPLTTVIMEECLVIYLRQQVDYIGNRVLSKLMNEWRLMDELAVLRAIYLLGSGDLLQHFLTVIFNKLDKGETWDDDFELNTILQESIRNSADGMLLSAPDSLVVSIVKTNSLDGDEQSNLAKLPLTPHKSSALGFGIDGLDSLKFAYKVSWPLELIANTEAIKKYNQVTGFLLKVKRAKFVLDKTRRWMWKGKGTPKNNSKRHWLVEQKLLHFVDAFHQYVMDRVYHSAWRELCEGMAAAQSLDGVIEVHEAYLLTIHRQCFVVPDKLWALIASRINVILGLALDFYSVQQTLSSGGAVSAIKLRCEMEVDRIEKQFDDCIAFLLRVLSFKLNVGHFPHLADLVTRINYSYFYMSDSGNLRTAPSAETVSSRLGKGFMGRTD
ncbi:gamma-tubulin complex component 5-like isoform X2 [Benincasa hispida]|uniref:gamma-tubulin complex component 5-like isoform X2 n=1 Tax=Benincasa hispida TaxID=102211 RepID=UPI0018FF9147|nr:gamma-tubulin complex component 5-like isoform X2 [Benincasa hispida]